MRISIFNLSDKSNYKVEYNKMIKVLNSKCITYKTKHYTYFEFINKFLFNNWKFRKTYLDVYEYLEFIGININSKKVSLDAFINFIEFILNMDLLLSKIKIYYDEVKYSTSARSIIYHNIPLILEKEGYCAYDLDDKIIISSIDTDYDDLKSILPDDINELILSYKNINNNGIKTKRMILDKMYSYLEKNIDKYKSYNSTLLTAVKQVINKMGVRYEIDKKYANLSTYKLRKYYDYSFSIMCYLIKTENIFKYRDSIKGKD